MVSSHDKNKFGVRSSLRKTLYVLSVIYIFSFSFQYGAYPKYIQLPNYFGDETMYSYDTSSPVYPIARKLATSQNVPLIHCDSTPSVDVGDQKGYKILTRIHWETQKWGVDTIDFLYRELILVPKEDSKVFSIYDVRWDKIKKLGNFQSVSMGYDDKYQWFSRMEIIEQSKLQIEFNLEGGDEQFTLLVNDLHRTENDVERSRKLRYLTTAVGERALPIVKDEIERALPIIKDEIDRGTSGALSLLCSIPGNESTQYIVKLYKQDKYKERIRELVNRPYTRPSNSYMGIKPYRLSTSDNDIRPEAKEIYLDFLTIAYNKGSQNYRDLSRPLKAIAQYKWIEALDIAKAIKQNPRTLSNYIHASLAIRSLENSPVNPIILEARDIVYKGYASEGDFEYKEFVQARRILYSSIDREGLFLVALSLVNNNGFRSVSRLHHYGYEVLLWLSTDMVYERIDQLSTLFGSQGNRYDFLGNTKEKYTYYLEHPNEWSDEIEKQDQYIMHRMDSTLPQVQTHSRVGTRAGRHLFR